MVSDPVLTELRQAWEYLAATDPLWAVLSVPEMQGNRWKLADFMATGRAEVDDLLERTREVSPHLDRKTALDFGCGVGRLSQALAQHFERVAGVDISEGMIEFAQRLNRFGERCVYHLSREKSLPFSNGTFDLVYSSRVLQHVPIPIVPRYIEDLVRVTAPGGLLVFQMPSHRIEPWPRLKFALLDQTPTPLLKAYRRLKYGRTLPPTYAMHGLAKQTITNVIKRSGGRLLAVDSDWSAGDRWVSYRYFVTPSSVAVAPNISEHRLDLSTK